MMSASFAAGTNGSRYKLVRDHGVWLIRVSPRIEVAATLGTRWIENPWYARAIPSADIDDFLRSEINAAREEIERLLKSPVGDIRTRIVLLPGQTA